MKPYNERFEPLFYFDGLRVLLLYISSYVEIITFYLRYFMNARDTMHTTILSQVGFNQIRMTESVEPDFIT